MKIFSTLKSYTGSGREQPSPVRAEIRSGLTLTGRVMKVEANGLTLFDFSGNKAWSQVAFPVKEGTLIDVLVLEDRPRLKLKRIDPTEIAPSRFTKISPYSGFPSEKALQKLQSGLGKMLDTEGWALKKTPLPRKIAAGLEQLAFHFRHLNLGRSISQLSSRLRSLVENSGIFFEKRIEKEVQTLQRAHTQISTRHLHQSPEIRDIIKNDLKPCLLILKHFIQENEPKTQNARENHLGRLKPMINQMLKDMAFEQTNSAGRPQEQAVNTKMVYTDPRKGNNVAFEKTEKLLPTIERLIPRLRHFANAEGPNASDGIRHSLLKVIETLEIASSKGNAANPNPVGYETALPLVLKEDMPRQLKKLADFFRHEAASNNLLDAKALEEIIKSLSRVRAEIDHLQAAGENPQKAQRPETEQVMAFTLPLREEDGKGRLKIFYSKRKKGGAEEGFKMSLFLEMENTGPVRTDFFLLNKKLKIAFYLIDHRIEKAILKQADAMKTALADHFSHVVIDVVVSERKVEDFDIEHLLNENARLIDLRV